MKAGAFDFLSKPVDLERCAYWSATRCADAAAGRRVAACRQLCNCSGDTEPMQALRSQIARLARSQAPVLHHRRIRHRQGAGGTLIHANGPRARRPSCRSTAAPSRRADGERVLRPPQGQLHRRGQRQAGLFQAATAARCSSTRWPTCRCRCRSSCCGRSRKRPCARSAPNRRVRSTCASSAPPTRTSPRKSNRGCFARPVLPHQRDRAAGAEPARAGRGHSATGRS
jgi:hypothetical protein